MVGFDDNGTIIGDWVPPPSPSTGAFFSALLGDEFSSRPIPELTFENRSGGIFPFSQEHISWKTDGADQLTDSSSSSEQKTNSRGGLLERMAARAGFNAPRLNTESIRPADLSQKPDVRSPYLTIPPGLSPTTLLESPVFLSNSLVQPSPTTGKFPFAPGGNGRNFLATEALSESKDDSFRDISTSLFAFKPVTESGPSLILGHTSNITSTNLPLQNFHVSVQAGNSLPSQNIQPATMESQNGTTLHLQDISRKDAEHSPSPNGQQDVELDQRGGGDTSVVGGGPSEDGYNWRKYGQKQVKGSEYPRSYFKCTHTDCLVKKKVERAHDGDVTEIIYKGTHNHTKPTPNHGLAIGSDMQLDIDHQTGVQIGVDGNPRWTTVQHGTTGGAQDWRRNNLEVTSSVSMGAEYCNAPTNGTNVESGEALDGGSAFSNDEEEDDRGTHGSISLGDDGEVPEGDESESKRRKIEAYATEMSGATRAIREPRVVVQTTSEVDILDDGYRWRKYGQKVVKGNPNPRSYYKCTSTGCNVRKHVERASHDLKSVITTYEGKHNHTVPAARNGSSVTPNSGPSQSSSATAGAIRSHLYRSEPSQPHNNMARFDRPTGMSSLGLSARQQLGFGAHNGFSFGMNQPGLSNSGVSGFGPGQGKPPVIPYFGQQCLSSEMGFTMPKEEPKAEPLSEPPPNLSLGESSVYHRIMNRLPLGPHM